MTSFSVLSIVLLGQGNLPGKINAAPTPASITAKEVSVLVGKWSGSIVMQSPESKDSRTAALSIEIQPISGTDTFSYKFSLDQKVRGDYILRPVNPAKGHWQVDRQNGVKLDAFWNGAGFTHVFEVGRNAIMSSEWLQGEHLHWQTISYITQPFAKTVRAQGPPEYSTFRVLDVQRAILTKK